MTKCHFQNPKVFTGGTDKKLLSAYIGMVEPQKLAKITNSKLQ